MKSLRAGALALGLVLGGAALAQQEGLVNVDISNLKADIAKDINVDVSQIPVTVQAPIGIAANVCNVSAAVLGKSTGGGGTCEAKSTSDALNNLVQRQLKQQK